MSDLPWFRPRTSVGNDSFFERVPEALKPIQIHLRDPRGTYGRETFLHAQIKDDAFVVADLGEQPEAMALLCRAAVDRWARRVCQYENWRCWVVEMIDDEEACRKAHRLQDLIEQSKG